MTYPLHVVIRYEIEKALIDGTLLVRGCRHVVSIDRSNICIRPLQMFPLGTIVCCVYNFRC